MSWSDYALTLIIEAFADARCAVQLRRGSDVLRTELVDSNALLAPVAGRPTSPDEFLSGMRWVWLLSLALFTAQAPLFATACPRRSTAGTPADRPS